MNRVDFDQLEAELMKEEQRLNPEQQQMVENQTNVSKANPIVAWILWWFLGNLGAHRFYLHRNYAVLMLVLDVIGWLLAFIIIGFPILGAIFIWWIIDAFSMQEWLREDYLLTKQRMINLIKSNDNSTFDGQFNARN
ncbi:TM2 domain-containing protein [Apilactobacillus apisilvae]|uniref:TM2 domain-containing protein n=1 Tax=Apilactobacillus apisilvae TaxID=2923364 RepID=A0ABY4PGF8_9LACO|nr:TM2 domain-containing protein [Apilactobacillus apisilvae]UQS84875.1 TM2 domain-containing protein [Apilactobacillus apisilvae]